MQSNPTTNGTNPPRLKRTLTLWDLVFYGLVLIQLTAPMPLFGVVSQQARGHVVLTILIAMVAMLFTAISYGRMARAYPLAGSAYTYVGREIHPLLGQLTGWSMAMDYMVNPIICVIWCSKAAGNILPDIPYAAWAFFFAGMFTFLNLRGVKTTARVNEGLALGMGVVVLIFFVVAVKYLTGSASGGLARFTRPFYDPSTFQLSTVLTGTSIAALTYIGFDGISTLSEEVENPRRNILLATVLTCLVTGLLAALEVYTAQLIWPDYGSFPDIDTAYSFVAGRVGGAWLFQLVNGTLLVASVGSGMGAQLAAARLLYGMGRENAIPKSFFGVIEAKRSIPRNNILFLGALALGGAFLVSYQLGAELLNFGAFIAFMGVNLAAFSHYFLRSKEKKLTHLLPPLIGFAICFYIWLSLRLPAKLAGTAWLAFGILYTVFRKKILKQQITLFQSADEGNVEG
jgi:putrescine importer